MIRKNFHLIIIYSILFCSGFLLYHFLLIALNLMSSSSTTTILLNLTGGFSGAFFGFLLVKGGNMVAMIYKRYATNYNSLVWLELYMNDIIQTINDNLSLWRERNMTIQQAIGNNQIPICHGHTDILPIEDKSLNLLNIDLRNDLLSFRGMIKKCNQSLETINDSYESCRAAVLNGNITKPEFNAACSGLIHGSQKVLKYLEFTSDRSILILSAVRVLCKQKALMGVVYTKIFSIKYSEQDKALIEQEESKLRREIEDIWEKSAKELNEIYSENDHSDIK
ncbi:hypothetical protein JXA32_04960 [Candidatus Sumerlaeota bacterium]|nr:hypothetical protein [Candidatus Sumerlaeota bacterium]